ncbi:MAG: UDP-N-acetylglucosamine 1-carboxyvinyltransferase [Acidobacteria bacterium]|nr:UDP-N-acetylglucosamine 1-carboxyvinyltransferase [Acidobacteriota bacterium]
MSTLSVYGPTRLEGRVEVDGNKNAALPLIAACLLTEDWCEIRNVPRIRDVEVMVRLLESLGADVEGIGTSSLRLRCREVTSDAPDPLLVGRLRGSVLLMGPLLARSRRVRLATPGGDFPSRRTLATHERALCHLGARPLEGPGHAFEAPAGLTPASFYLDEASVTGTETALLAAAAAPGVSEIRHAATEPHVVDLCRWLTTMGAEIEGAGTSTLRVRGQQRLGGGTCTIGGDYIEAGSWAVAFAATGGAGEIVGAAASDLEPITAVLQRMGVDCDARDDRLVVRPSVVRNISKITTGLWPSFPSDLVSLVTVLATQAEGRALVHDWMYELRLFALEQLSGMGADLFLCDPHRIIVTGPSRLRGRALDSRDLRSGMSLIVAALAAEGESRVAPLETVERGYANLVARLQTLGARVGVG